MPWFLNPSLTKYREEVNERWPNRDKTTDGTIGNAAHKLHTSDHNQDPDGSVDAWDMDHDIVRGDHAASDRIIYDILIPAFQRHPAARYWIYQRKIAHRFEDNWAIKPYTGESPHDEHCHFNSNQATENNTSQWLPEDVMAITPQQQADFNEGMSSYVSLIANADTAAGRRLRTDWAKMTGANVTNVNVTDDQLVAITSAVSGVVIDALKSGAFKFEEDSTP